VIITGPPPVTLNVESPESTELVLMQTQSRCMSAGLSVWLNLFTFYQYCVDSKAIFMQDILESNLLTLVDYIITSSLKCTPWNILLQPLMLGHSYLVAASAQTRSDPENSTVHALNSWLVQLQGHHTSQVIFIFYVSVISSNSTNSSTLSTEALNRSLR